MSVTNGHVRWHAFHTANLNSILILLTRYPYLTSCTVYRILQESSFHLLSFIKLNEKKMFNSENNNSPL